MNKTGQSAATENKSDRDYRAAVELAVVTEWADSIGVKVVPYENCRWPVSFALLRSGTVVGVAEALDAPDGVESYVGLKLYRAMSLWTYHRESIPAFFVVRLAGTIKWLRINERIQSEMWPIRWIGNKKEKTAIVCVPVEKFNPIKPR